MVVYLSVCIADYQGAQVLLEILAEVRRTIVPWYKHSRSRQVTQASLAAVLELARTAKRASVDELQVRDLVEAYTEGRA